MIDAARENDLPAWIALASEVDELFGANMSASPEFLETLRRNIARGSAYCARIDGELAGAMLYRNGWIHWLAVRTQFRQRGIASALIRYTQKSGEPEVHVTTFGDEHPHPDAAIALRFYSAMSFERTDKAAHMGEDGTPRVVLRWQQKKVH